MAKPSGLKQYIDEQQAKAQTPATAAVPADPMVEQVKAMMASNPALTVWDVRRALKIGYIRAASLLRAADQQGQGE